MKFEGFIGLPYSNDRILSSTGRRKSDKWLCHLLENTEPLPILPRVFFIDDSVATRRKKMMRRKMKTSTTTKSRPRNL